MRAGLRASAALALLGVAVQIVYPHTSGGARDAMTVATVLLFAGAALVHVAVTRGWRAAAHVLAVLGGGGLAAEVVGVAAGVPFGGYAYADRLGAMAGDVPLVIPLAWVMLGWPAAVVAATLLGGRPPAGRLQFALVGAVALTAWDLFLDPQMVAAGYWTWEADGPALLSGIPAVNYVGWLVVSAGMMALLRPTAPGAPGVWDGSRGDPVDDRIPLLVYAWTWVGSVVAHLFYLDLPTSGIVGGVGMGVVVAALGRRLRAGAAT